MGKLKLINYTGNKFRYTKNINNMFEESDKTTYFEPFVGSASVLLNLRKTYDKYIVNDKNKKLILMLNYFKSVDYGTYKDHYNYVINRFGLLSKKVSYVEFRNYFNEHYHNSGTLEEGVFLYMLCNSCINSMMRYGKKGFNQSSGYRDRDILSESEFNRISDILDKTEITNDVMTDIDLSKIVNYDVFLDPPYVLSGVNYNNNKDTFIRDYIEFISKLIDNECYIVGTDVDAILEYLPFKINYKILRVIKKAGPNSQTSRPTEIIYKVEKHG